MKLNEIVWRTLADGALNGRRDWPDVGALAAVAGVNTPTTHHALRRLVDIGAVQIRRRGGAIVLAPEKVLVMLSAYRNLVQDTVAMTTLHAAQSLADAAADAVSFGGADAAVHWLGGVNTVADKGVRILYVAPDALEGDLPQGTEARIIARDDVAGRTWRSGYASIAQTYADLFALPGWQASEFRTALHRHLFADADWDQKRGDHAEPR